MTPTILAVTVTPAAADFGDVELGTFAHFSFRQPGAFAIANSDATATVMIDRVVVIGDPAFELLGPDHMTLPPGDSARLDGTFTPTALGPVSAQIAVFADGGTVPVAQVAVTATGIPAPKPDDGNCSAGGPGSGLPIAIALALVVRCRFRDRNFAPRP